MLTRTITTDTKSMMPSAAELRNNTESPMRMYHQHHEEINRKVPYKRNRNRSMVSVSSASSTHSDSSEGDVAETAPTKDAIQEDEEAGSTPQSSIQTSEDPNENVEFKKRRSMSDGAVHRLPNQQEPFEVFPSLPDSVLEKMGLLGGGIPRERLNEEDIEQKFVALALAFTIDAATIKDRCVRQRRYRDQTEVNLTVEIERLVEKANRIQPLCVDAETTELLTALLTQIDVVMRASSHATTCSERYGAVQHEERISESVSLMINHVNLLKQQRDSARRQLQYTKRVLQNSNTVEPQPTAKQLVTTTSNGRIITRRRASIATITQSPEALKNLDVRKITRRISDLSLRATVSRSARPSRLELGVDLVKIKEGMVESEPVTNEPTPDLSDNESNVNEEMSSPEDSQIFELNDSQLPFRHRILRRMRRLTKSAEEKYNKWTDDGTIHEICCFCALMCFSISLITMANVLVEIEFAKRGLNNPSRLFWFFSPTGGNEDTAHLNRRTYHGGMTTT